MVYVYQLSTYDKEASDVWYISFQHVITKQVTFDDIPVVNVW